MEGGKGGSRSDRERERKVKHRKAQTRDNKSTGTRVLIWLGSIDKE